MQLHYPSGRRNSKRENQVVMDSVQDRAMGWAGQGSSKLQISEHQNITVLEMTLQNIFWFSATIG